jgi:hypothetical protein
MWRAPARSGRPAGGGGHPPARGGSVAVLAEAAPPLLPPGGAAAGRRATRLSRRVAALVPVLLSLGATLRSSLLIWTDGDGYIDAARPDRSAAPEGSTGGIVPAGPQPPMWPPLAEVGSQADSQRDLADRGGPPPRGGGFGLGADALAAVPLLEPGDAALVAHVRGLLQRVELAGEQILLLEEGKLTIHPYGGGLHALRLAKKREAWHLGRQGGRPYPQSRHTTRGDYSTYMSDSFTRPNQHRAAARAAGAVDREHDYSASYNSASSLVVLNLPRSVHRAKEIPFASGEGCPLHQTSPAGGAFPLRCTSLRSTWFPAWNR